MVRPDFLSPTERLELEACFRSHREDHGITRSANAHLLLDDGKSCQVIAEFLYLATTPFVADTKPTVKAAGRRLLSMDGNLVWPLSLVQNGGPRRSKFLEPCCHCSIDFSMFSNFTDPFSPYFTGLSILALG